MFDRHFAVWPEGVPRRLDLPERRIDENLRRTAEQVPEKAALLYHGAALSYAELDAQVDALAGWLQREAGVGRGDRVLLYLQNSPHFVIAYYAALRAGAVVAPANPMSRAAELDALIADAGARVAIAGQELLEGIAPAAREGRLARLIVAAYADMADPSCDAPPPSDLAATGRSDYEIPGAAPWREALAAGAAPARSPAGPDDLAVIAYTSGATGRPKGCMHSHRTIMANAIGSVAWDPASAGDASLATLPFFHVTGMQSSMNGPIACGETIAIMTRWDRRAAAMLIERHRLARWRAIAAMVIDLVNDPDLPRYDLSSLRLIGGGGAAMPEAVARRLKEATGLDYVEGYGLTETMAASHMNPARRPKRQCLGVPFFGVDARVIDPETHEELGPETPGEIVLRGPQVFLGYWNAPEATEAAFLQIEGRRFLRTGDIGRYDAEGYFFLVDRLKRMVNAAGYKVWPNEVESLLHEHPAVAEACVVGAPDPRRGESVLAFVKRRAPLTEAALIDWCRGRMAAYKVPRRVTFLEALPRSSSGKVQWRRLQEQARMDAAAQAAGDESPSASSATASPSSGRGDAPGSRHS